MDEVTRLVSTGDTVKIWDGVSMALLEQFNPHSVSHPVAQACWSSNNQYLVSASSSGDNLVVSSLKSTPTAVVELADGRKQTRVCLSSSSQFLVSGGLDHGVHIWDLKTKRLHRSLKDHKEEVTCVSFNANDSYIASGSTSGDLVLHSLTTNLSSKAFGHGSNQPVHDLRLSALKRSLLGSVSDSGTVVLELLVVSVGLDKKIVCYDTASKIVLRSIRVDSPLTSVDFTLDGTGLVVGSTQGKIYQYDLRNSSAPTRITVAHKTSVSCLRFQSNSRHKSSKLSSTKISSTKRSSTKLLNSQSDSAPSTGPAPHRQVTSTGGAAADLTSREAEGQQGSEQLPVAEKFSSIGRNSLDVFSPAREDSRTQGTAGDTPFGRTHVTSLEMLSREGEGQQVVGRASLDVFSPVREDCLSAAGSQRKTPLGTPLVGSAGRCYSPLSTFQTPPPIKEEEPASAAAAEPCDPESSSSLEGEGQTTPTSSQQTNHSQLAPPFFTPEPSLRRANGIQAQLSYDSPVQVAPPTTTAGPALSVAVSSSLSQNIADVVGQAAAAPLTSLQIHFIQNMIHETLEDFRDACHRDIVNLQVEMNEIHGLIEKYSVNESLVEEIERLKEENRKLRTNY
ncbi:Protein NEDD1 Neural precursor cell expressed developmentally down-regulated protein 1 [Larimichthys crocea]|uniref:Protein NEDD1 Neural cell expressed developmentally down-regulated protein 1 n=1 Tax=Larimichthys crocea TaxID=215358 RepID=A0A6G0HDQ8_LARCR|nr:Protein NEDD1 Neural precursor cell expressed developmentally down-regulated protein 1 [Larimichthys crocea]